MFDDVEEIPEVLVMPMAPLPELSVPEMRPG